MDFDKLTNEFEAEGFKVQPAFPGFLIGKRRREPRFLSYQEHDQTIALHGDFETGKFAVPGDILRFEVCLVQTSERSAAIAVKAEINDAEELAFFLPHLEAVLNALRRLSE